MVVDNKTNTLYSRSCIIIMHDRRGHILHIKLLQRLRANVTAQHRWKAEQNLDNKCKDTINIRIIMIKVMNDGDDDHTRRTGPVSFRGAEVSWPNILSIACPKIKCFFRNITWFSFGPNMAIWKIIGPPPPRLVRLWWRWRWWQLSWYEWLIRGITTSSATYNNYNKIDQKEERRKKTRLADLYDDCHFRRWNQMITFFLLIYLWDCRDTLVLLVMIGGCMHFVSRV